MQNRYDLIVVGAGHAGCEAARAAARLGARTALITMNADLVAQMSCNPAIGGIAKGHLVREIDALGGIMGEIADAAGIQFRLLNTSRGPAVWSPRAQCDKRLYRVLMKQALEQEPNLRILQAEVGSLLLEGRRVTGVQLRDGRELQCGAVVITTGTFLNGEAHVGETRYSCGRNGEPASQQLGQQLRDADLRWSRLKTGTPPRLDGRTIHWDQFEPQSGDAEPTPFSFLTDKIDRPQIQCYLAHTNAATHALLRENLHRSPLYSGQIEGIGPRYCPSIEDKVVKFPDRARHQVYLEPEGLDTNEVYVNGMSTSLPLDIQTAVIASIPGLEDAELIRPGYAIEYDTIDARELTLSLEVKSLRGLFLAGQINGTSGYEEAACQGLMAGLNAAASLSGRDPLVLSRTEAYIGILIDDLVSKGTDEPYRMFTSRAEYRLHLRIDNADQRLTPIGERVGLAASHRVARLTRRSSQIERIRKLLESVRINTTQLAQPGENPLLIEWLLRPGNSIQALSAVLSDALGEPIDRGTLSTIETESKYAGYIRQQERTIARSAHSGNRRIPTGFSFSQVPSLSREVIEKLDRVRPETLAQASRIPGITPASLSILEIYLAGSSARASGQSTPELHPESSSA